MNVFDLLLRALYPWAVAPHKPGPGPGAGAGPEPDPNPGPLGFNTFGIVGTKSEAKTVDPLVHKKKCKIIIEPHFRLKWAERWDDEVALKLPRWDYKDLADRDVGGLYGEELLGVLDWFSQEWGNKSFPLGVLIRRGIQDVWILDGTKNKQKVRIDLGAPLPVVYEHEFECSGRWMPFLDNSKPLEFTPPGQEQWAQINVRALMIYKLSDYMMRLIGINVNVDSPWESHEAGATVRFPINVTAHIYHNYRLDKDAEMSFATWWNNDLMGFVRDKMYIWNMIRSIPWLGKTILGTFEQQVPKKTSTEKWLEGWYWHKKADILGW